MTPIAQTSTAAVSPLADPLKTSGAMYIRLPASAASALKLLETPAIPKSMIFI